jgi:hypothetical protein
MAHNQLDRSSLRFARNNLAQGSCSHNIFIRRFKQQFIPVSVQAIKSTNLPSMKPL